jgi:hypothetical protein
MDIEFDTKVRDIVLSGGAFATVDNASAQNGGIILEARCAYRSNPMLCIGLEDTIQSHPEKTGYELNRWQTQVYADGAKFAKWTVTNVNDVDTEINY